MSAADQRRLIGAVVAVEAKVPRLDHCLQSYNSSMRSGSDGIAVAGRTVMSDAAA